MHRIIKEVIHKVSKPVGSKGERSVFVNGFLVLFTIQNTIWDSFTKRMFCLDKHKISPEMLCYPVDNVEKFILFLFLKLFLKLFKS